MSMASIRPRATRSFQSRSPIPPLARGQTLHTLHRPPLIGAFSLKEGRSPNGSTSLPAKRYRGVHDRLQVHPGEGKRRCRLTVATYRRGQTTSHRYSASFNGKLQHAVHRDHKRRQLRLKRPVSSKCGSFILLPRTTTRTQGGDQRGLRRPHQRHRRPHS